MGEKVGSTGGIQSELDSDTECLSHLQETGSENALRPDLFYGKEKAQMAWNLVQGTHDAPYVAGVEDITLTYPLLGANWRDE